MKNADTLPACTFSTPLSNHLQGNRKGGFVLHRDLYFLLVITFNLANLTCVCKQRCHIAGNFIPTKHALIGYFVVTWHLTRKLFKIMKSLSRQHCKIYDVRGSAHSVLPANVDRPPPLKYSEVEWMSSFKISSCVTNHLKTGPLESFVSFVSLGTSYWMAGVEKSISYMLDGNNIHQVSCLPKSYPWTKKMKELTLPRNQDFTARFLLNVALKSLNEHLFSPLKRQNIHLSVTKFIDCTHKQKLNYTDWLV